MNQQRKELLVQLADEKEQSSLVDILIIGYQAPTARDRKLIQTALTHRHTPLGPGILHSTEHLSFQELGELLGGRKGKYARASSTLQTLRETLSGRVPGFKEKLNPRGGYVGYRTTRSDRAYVYVQPTFLVIDIQRPRTIEPTLKKTGIEIIYRNNYQGRAGWTTGIRLLHDAPLSQVEMVADQIIQALTE